ncbi:gliding motility-associated C-terminal domain-containing protein [Mucilaginibacter sp.]|jgi:gliding motility-associated-like protein|uniref:gliding motility-associated C-terminal domain-containing protein n=1 Tax=Mucilaginibacter sp. TaxID=1882438 RepID=UPI00356ACAEC
MLACLTTYSQQFYIITNGGVKRITITKTGYTGEFITGCAQIGTIALYKNTLYTITGDGSISQSTISGNTTIDCKLVANTPCYGAVGMTVNERGVLYFAAATDLYKLDPQKPVAELVGTMPYRCAGDFIFNKGTLYMAAIEGIVKVNLSNPPLSTLVIPLTTISYGMASLLGADGQIKPYATTSNSISGTDLLELDFVKNVVTKAAYNIAEPVGDAASEVESGTLLNNIVVSEQCDNPGKGQIQVSAIGDKKPIYYSLNGGAADTVGLYQNLSSGTYNIRVTAPDTVLNTTAEVPDYSLNRPAVTYTVLNTKCELSGQITFHIADDGDRYKIKFNADTLAFTQPITGLATGTYRFMVLRENGCLYGTYDVTIGRTKCDIIVTDVTVAQQCNALLRGTVAVNTPTHAYPYTYTLNGINNSNGAFSDVDKGSYQIKITSSEDTIYVPVTVPDYKLTVPAFNVIQRAELCDLGGEITFNNTGNTRLYQLQFNGALYAFNHTFTNLHAGHHLFTIFDEKGCIVDTAGIQLVQLPCSPVVFPNTFTPNGDGINDIFRPNQDSRARQYKLHIYNRLGQEVFFSTNMFEGWPGTSNNKNAPAGIYYWVVNFVNEEQKPAVQKGWVSLLR